jgi:hypothetical protein
MTRDPKRLLGGYATDSLTEEERSELLRAALDDQELFDAVLENEGLRELLESPGARNELLAALERPTAWERVRAWFGRPATFGHLATAVAVLVVAVAGSQVLFRGTPEGQRRAASSPLVAPPVSPATRARLLALPERVAPPAKLELDADDARVRSGEALVLRVSVPAPARVLVIGERPDGSSAQIFPASGSPPALVGRQPAGGPVVQLVPLLAPVRPGASRVRLVVAPVDVDLAGAAPGDVDRLASRLTLVDLTYEVVAP